MGFAPVSFEKIANNDKLDSQVKIKLKCQTSVFDLSYNICLLITWWILNAFFNPFMCNDDYPDKTKITDTIESCQGLFQFLSLNITWIYFCSKRRTIVDAVNQFIDMDLTMIKITWHYKIDSNYHLIIFLCASNIIIGTGVLVSHIVGLPGHMSYLVQIFGGILENWIVIAYTIILITITNRVRSLNKVLVEIGGRSLKSEVEFFFTTRVRLSSVSFMELISVRRAMTTLHTISYITADILSFPILWIVIYNIVTLVYTAYYFIIPFIYPTSSQTPIIIFNSGITILMVTFPIIMLTDSVIKINDAVGIYQFVFCMSCIYLKITFFLLF